MGGIEGILGVPEPAKTRPSQGGTKAPAKAAKNAIKDEIAFSLEAKELATAGQMVSNSEIRAAIRDEKIRQAKERIEQGTYKVNEVVEQVAQRIGAYIE